MDDSRTLRLERALELALSWLAPLEPPDSRAVSDEFVAMAAVRVNIEDEKCMAVIDAALERAAISSGQRSD